jgi:uncharacterized protein
MSHPNEKVLRAMYDAYYAGDGEAFLDLLADDVVWHALPGTPMAGTYRGKVEVADLLAQIADATGGSFSIEVHDVLANDEHAVGLVRARGEREGRTLDEPHVHVVHVNDDRIVEFWSHPHDTSKYTAFFE